MFGDPLRLMLPHQSSFLQKHSESVTGRDAPNQRPCRLCSPRSPPFRWLHSTSRKREAPRLDGGVRSQMLEILLAALESQPLVSPLGRFFFPPISEEVNDRIADVLAVDGLSIGQLVPDRIGFVHVTDHLVHRLATGRWHEGIRPSIG